MYLVKHSCYTNLNPAKSQQIKFNFPGERGKPENPGKNLSEQKFMFYLLYLFTLMQITMELQLLEPVYEQQKY